MMDPQTIGLEIAQPLVSTALVAAINEAPEAIGFGIGLGYAAMTKNSIGGIQIWGKFDVSKTTTKSVATYALPTLAIEHCGEKLLKDTPMMKDRKTKELTKIAFLVGVNVTAALLLKKPLKDAALLTVAEYTAITAKDYLFDTTQ